MGNLAGFIFDFNFAESEVHLTAIQALSNHKKKYGGRLEEFSAYMGHVVGSTQKMGFGSHFPHITSQFSNLLLFS